MLSIQEVGKQVLTGHPMSFYIFVGHEYGIKEKYLDSLRHHYNAVSEISKVSELFDMMNRKQIIPLQPRLYIVRYDEDFLQSVDKKSIEQIRNVESKIVGTIVCIYEASKHTDKCAKYLPEYTVSFDPVSREYIKKYLVSDYPELSSNLIEFSTQVYSDYMSAYNVCLSLTNADDALIMLYDGNDIAKTLGASFSTSDKQFRYGIASRNFEYCLSVIDNYTGQLDGLIYTFLSTIIDLEKLLSNPRQQTDLNKYQKCWNISDVYHMFMHVYTELEKLRSVSTYDVYNGLIYLIGILQFSPIPEVNVLCS